MTFARCGNDIHSQRSRLNIENLRGERDYGQGKKKAAVLGFNEASGKENKMKGPGNARRIERDGQVSARNDPGKDGSESTPGRTVSLGRSGAIGHGTKQGTNATKREP